MEELLNKKVMLFGTFDGLHKGHLHFIKKASKLGEKIIIVLARDKNVLRVKNKTPLQNETERLKSVQKAFPSAKVILGDLEDYYKPIQDFSPHIITLGYDQKANLKELKEKFPNIQIVKISAFQPHKYKSSLLNNQKQCQT